MDTEKVREIPIPSETSLRKVLLDAVINIESCHIGMDKLMGRRPSEHHEDKREPGCIWDEFVTIANGLYDETLGLRCRIDALLERL